MAVEFPADQGDGYFVGPADAGAKEIAGGVGGGAEEAFDAPERVFENAAHAAAVDTRH